jgi:hypothetical protein
MNTGGGLVNAVSLVVNDNGGVGSIYVTGGTCAGPDVNNILAVVCDSIQGLPSGVPVEFCFDPVMTSDTDPTWVILVGHSGGAFFVAFNESTLGTPNAGYGNLSGLPDPGEWQDLNNFGFGACYSVTLGTSECIIPEGACCLGDGTCSEGTAADCNAQGGTYMGDDTLCADVSCVGACCYSDGTCSDGSADGCVANGGQFQGLGTDCANTFCPVLGENDLCVDAIHLDVPSTVSGTTEGSTFDDVGTCGTSNSAPGVWYHVVGSGNGMTASTCADFPDYYDTKISVFCGTCDALTCVGGNDDNCSDGSSGLLSTVDWCSQSGASYYILVHGFSSGEGPFELTVSDDGTPCIPDVLCIPIGACCLGGQCVDALTQDECESDGGSYQGDDTSCAGGFIGWTVEACNGDFMDISGTGTPGPTGDDGGLTVPIGFTFNFYGDAHSEIGMGTNGYLTFGSDLTDFSDDAIPNTNDPNDLIAPLWDDYVVDGSGATHYQTMGDAPDRMFIAQWTNVRQFAGSDANTFQAILYEGSNCIQFRYGEFNTSDYTVGVENQDGTDGASVPTVAPGECWSFCPNFEDPIVCIVYMSMDIKGGSCPAPFNRGSNGVTPITLLGDAGTDIMMVDLASVMISRADGAGGAVGPHEGPPGPHSTYGDNGMPNPDEDCGCNIQEGDGLLDLNMKFKTQDMVDALELEGELPGALIALTLTGYLTDGTPFVACDNIRLVPGGGGGGAAMYIQAGQDGWVDVAPLDNNLDGGGFGKFNRNHNLGSVMTFHAEAIQNRRPFEGWYVNGQLVNTRLSLTWVITSPKTSIEARYDSSHSTGTGK